jgi:hypothetical protein
VRNFSVFLSQEALELLCGTQRLKFSRLPLLTNNGPHLLGFVLPECCRSIAGYPRTHFSRIQESRTEIRYWCCGWLSSSSAHFAQFRSSRSKSRATKEAAEQAMLLLAHTNPMGIFGLPMKFLGADKLHHWSTLAKCSSDASAKGGAIA